MLRSEGTAAAMGNVTLAANGTGGNGGNGVVQGGGGNAAGGIVRIESLVRSGRTERGNLIAGNVTASGKAMAGSGGSGVTIGGQLQLRNLSADMRLNGLSFANSGTSAALPNDVSIEVSDGTLGVLGPMSANALGDMNLNVHDGGVLRATSLTLDARGSLVSIGAPGPGGLPGLIDAGSLTATVGRDINLRADIIVGSATSLTANYIKLGNLDINGGLQVSAASIELGNVKAVGTITLTNTGSGLAGTPNPGLIATGSLQSINGNVSAQTLLAAIRTGAVSAGDSITFLGRSISTTGDMTAATRGGSSIIGAIDLTAIAGPLAIRNASGASIKLSQGDGTTANAATITAGNLTAETIAVGGDGTASLGNVTSGNFYAGLNPAGNFQIMLGTAGNLGTGAVASAGFLGLGSRDGSVTATGALSSPGSILVLAGQGVSLAGVTGGTGAGDSVYISNSSLLASDPRLAPYANFSNGPPFDPALLIAIVTVVPARAAIC